VANATSPRKLSGSSVFRREQYEFTALATETRAAFGGYRTYPRKSRLRGCLWLYWMSVVVGAVSFYCLYWARYHRHLRTYFGARAGVILAPLGIGLSAWFLLRTKRGRRTFVCSHVLALLLLVATVCGVRLVAGFWAPGWPAHELRPMFLTCAKLGEKGAD